MQTFKSTCKLTPEIISQYQNVSGKLLDAALTILIIVILACFISIFAYPCFQNLSHGEWRFILLFFSLPIAAICYSFNLYILPHIHRAFLRSAVRSNEKRFGTPSPTLETRIEDNTIITRILEAGTEERSPIHGCTAIQTNNHIFIRCSRSHLAIFTITDFSEEVLNDLLSTLSEYGAEIMPK